MVQPALANGNDLFYGNSGENDDIVGLLGNDILSGTPLDATGTDGGIDFIYGDSVDLFDPIGGSDFLLGGVETDNYGGGDDSLFGGGGNDVIYGIYQKDGIYSINSNGLPVADSGWIDDAPGFLKMLWKDIIGDIGRSLRYAFGDRINFRKQVYEGDLLHGGLGRDVIFGGHGDVIYANPNEDFTFGIKPLRETVGGDRGQVGRFRGKFIQTAELDTILMGYPFWDPENIASEVFSDNFTYDTELATLPTDGNELSDKKPGPKPSIKLPGILRDENGNVIFRFPTGVSYFSQDGSTYYFIAREDGQPLQSGDFGIEFPSIENVDNYYIGSWPK